MLEKISEKLLLHHKRSFQTQPGRNSSVPYRSRNELEIKAEELLEWIRPSLLAEPCLTPVVEIAERLNKEFGVRIESRDLGYSPRGRKILGACQFKPRAIFLDTTLDPSSTRYRFTFAHEIGHLILHRKLRLNPAELDIAVNEIRDEPIHFYFGRRRARSPREWLEWQANVFASALLMPKATLKTAVLEKQQAMGTRRLGTIHVDNQPTNVVDYFEITNHLMAIYQVSRMALHIRLKHLRILEDRRRFNPQHITTLLREE